MAITIYFDESKVPRWSSNAKDDDPPVGERILVGAVVVPDPNSLEAGVDACARRLLADDFVWAARSKSEERRELFAQEGFHYVRDDGQVLRDGLNEMLQHPIRAHVCYSHLEWTPDADYQDTLTAMYFTLVRTLLQRYAGAHLELVFEQESSMDSRYGMIIQHAVDVLDRDSQKVPRRPRATVEARIAEKPNGGLSTVDYCLGVANLGLRHRYRDGKREIWSDEKLTVARLDSHIAHVVSFDSAVHRRRFDILRPPSWAQNITGVSSRSGADKPMINTIIGGPTGPFMYVATTAELASALGVAEKTLLSAVALACDPDSYEFHEVAVRGKVRILSVPVEPPVLHVQRRVLDLLEPLNEALHPSCTAYIPGRSARNAAAPHCGATWIQKLDVANFFESITTELVIATMQSLGASEEVAGVIGALTTLEGRLPTGPCTSPILSNLVLGGFDVQVAEDASRKLIRYTRYADDLIFSGDTLFDMEPLASELLRSLGLTLNVKKTLCRRRGQPVRVAGLSVFEKDSPRIPRPTKRRLRMELFLLERDLERGDDVDPIHQDELDARLVRARGLVNYCKSVENQWTDRLLARFPVAAEAIRQRNRVPRHSQIVALLGRIAKTRAPRLTRVSQGIGGEPPLASLGFAHRPQ